MADLAIKGHTTRGKEVIEILKMLGGKNIAFLDGTKDNIFYFINGNIICGSHGSDKICGIKYFSLEEFFEKFPYKVGDKVMTDDGDKADIVGMVWDNDINDVFMKYRFVTRF